MNDRSVAPSLDDLAARTPASRDRVIDLLRVVSIGCVVLGHWTMAVVTYRHGAFGATNALAEVPALQLATWVFQVMPLFFVVGAYANRAALLAARRRGDPPHRYLLSRTARLVGPVVPLAVAGVIAAAALGLTDVDPAGVHTLMKVIAQPLWFLAVYLLVVAATPTLLAAHERSPRIVLGALGASILVIDALRLGDRMAWAWWANYAFVFLFVSELGLLLADGTIPSLSRRRLVALGGGALVVLVALVVGPYPVSMVGVPGEQVSNMSPPTVCIALLAIVQTAIATLARPSLARWLEAPRRWRRVIAANSVVMTVFLWHLPSLAVVAAIALPLGTPQPDPGTAAWWLLKLGWVAATVAVLAICVLAARGAERPRSLPPSSTAPRTVVAFAASFAAMTVLALFGLAGIAGVVGAALAALAAHLARSPGRRPSPDRAESAHRGIERLTLRR